MKSEWWKAEWVWFLLRWWALSAFFLTYHAIEKEWGRVQERRRVKEREV